MDSSLTQIKLATSFFRPSLIDECLSTSIEEWLSTVPRTCSPSSTSPRSAQAECLGSEALATVDYHQAGSPIDAQPVLPAYTQQTSQSRRRSLSRASSTSSQNLRAKIVFFNYRTIIYCNGIHMDHMGNRMPRGIRDLMDEKILQGRTSPALSDEEVHKVIRQSLALANFGGTEVSSLLATEMFPVRCSNIEKGSNTMWRTDALPYNFKFGQSLAAPKPDAFFGYPRVSDSVWTEDENIIV